MHPDDELIQAVNEGDLEKTREIVRRHRNVAADDNAPIMYATHSANAAMVELLLKLGANIRARNDYCLRQASETREREITEIILGTGAYENEPALALLGYAALGDIEKIQSLAAKGAGLDAHNSMALIDACDWGETQVVQALLDAGASPTAENNEPAIRSAKSGHLETLELVLKYGGKIWGPDPGDIPLYHAVTCKKERVTEFLLEKHTDGQLQAMREHWKKAGDYPTLLNIVVGEILRRQKLEIKRIKAEAPELEP